ncbi:MAG: TetR/AcrR family transcriptional regulator [Alcanivoracaceae bacterium]|jgi:AcrR family transcriptional regulator|nr:TetR/AcrR family transcriptional regulator [Alcanivoracaceae bacterium]
MDRQEDTAARCREAFVARLMDVGYSQVRMGDVARQAGVSRPTLYRYYHSREELFRATADAMFEEFYDQAGPYLENFDDSLSMALNFMAATVAYHNPRLIRALVDSGADDIFTSQLRKYFARMVGSMLRQKGQPPIHSGKLSLLTALLAGACFHTVRQWLRDDWKQSPREVSEVLTQCFNGQLVQVLLQPVSQTD